MITLKVGCHLEPQQECRVVIIPALAVGMVTLSKSEREHNSTGREKGGKTLRLPIPNFERLLESVLVNA